jgi:hypothetical protein
MQPSALPEARRISSPTAFLTQKTPVESLPDQKSVTKATLQPVVDSLVAKGISADKIQVQIYTNFSDSKAKILMRLEKPTRVSEAPPLEVRIQEIVATANKATSKLENLTIKTVNVDYAVKNCQALQSSVVDSFAKISIKTMKKLQKCLSQIWSQERYAFTYTNSSHKVILRHQGIHSNID